MKLTAIFLLNYFIQLLLYPLVLYVRAHKVEVFLPLTISTSVLCFILVYFSSMLGSLFYVAISTLLRPLVIDLLHLILFLTKLKICFLFPYLDSEIFDISQL